ncbi:MAG: NAD(P)/FAD-dependent oxidoreductase [bacterium]
MFSVAVIGAGVAGSIAAHQLNQEGYSVTVFDKSRGVGGRMATRRNNAGEFDHGACAFISQTSEFRRALSRAPVQSWPCDTDKNTPAHLVGVPRQNQLVKYWLDTTKLALDCRIQQLTHTTAGWQLTSDQNKTFGPFPGVVIAVPAPQARDLLSKSQLPVPVSLTTVNMDPVWALMFSLDNPLSAPFHTNLTSAWNAETGIQGLSANFTKPGRPLQPDRFAYVAHATSAWSRAHLESDPDEIAELMLKTLTDSITSFPAPDSASAHRWRFALTRTPLGSPCLSLPDQLILAGDWCLGRTVEDAFLSGTAAAQQLHQRLREDPA